MANNLITGAGTVSTIERADDDSHAQVVTVADDVFTITPTLSTTAYEVNDTLFDATEINDVALQSGKSVTLVSVTLIDKDEQGFGLWLIFFDRSATFGTLLAAPSTSDSDAANIVGQVHILGSDWIDIGGAYTATANFSPIKMKPNATDLYVGGKTEGTPDYASTSSLILKLGFDR